MKYKILLSILSLSIASFTQSTQAGLFSFLKKNETVDQNDYAQTKYPILFVHGMFGFKKLGLPEFGVDYWHQIIPDLKRNGAQAFTAQVSPLNSTEVRGEQLLKEVDDLLALTGKSKVNLIGHSHGGPTARYIAGVAPDKVASVTSVGGVNFGSPVADIVQGVKPLNWAFATLVDNLISPVISYAQLHSNFPSDFKASIQSLSTEGSLAFNQKYPLGLPTQSCKDGPNKDAGIYFYSWTGISNTTNILDPDTLFTAAGAFAFDKQPNDGLVSKCSTKLGKTIRDDYEHNHFDEVNQVLGLKKWSAPDPVSLYRQHANRLKLQGL